jgi:poly(beta-D-mannuronate) lyase
MPRCARVLSRVLRAGVTALALAAAGPGRAALRSPWDGDAPAASGLPYRCPAPIPLPRDVAAEPYYADARHSVPDPARLAAWTEAARPFHAALAAVEGAADAYRATGSTAAARCALGLLGGLARDGALTGAISSEQAAYLRGWTAGGLALADLKIRPAVRGAPEQEVVAAWLSGLGSAVRDRSEARRRAGRTDARNNHRYWDALTVAAAGIAADRPDALAFGEQVFREAAGDIRPDGVLPLEVARGRRALHYHLFAAAPLVVLAELAAANDVDLYGVEGGAIHRLVRRIAGDLRGEGVVARRAGAEQDVRGPSDVQASELSWAPAYLRRFPAPALEVLRPKEARPDAYLGGGWGP